MPVIQTADGPVAFANWSYLLQGRGGKPLDVATIAAIDAGLVVVDHARDGTAGGVFSPAEVDAMQGAGADRKVVLAYISIGESEDFRFYWNEAWTKDGTAGGALRPDAPDWLGPVNPDWPESRKIRYWDPEWQEIAFAWVETIAAQGFDGAYLDIVDAYYFWAHEVRGRDTLPGDPKTGSEAAARMIDFIVELAAHARAINPDFVLIQQNAPFLLNDLVHDTGGKPKDDPARIAALHDAIAGIAVEDLYVRGGRDENNRFKPDKGSIKEILDSYAKSGEFVLAVDYATKPGLIEKFIARAEDDGFIPYAAPDRGLDRLAVHGTPGDDTLTGSAGGDRIYGLSGSDEASGLGGRDLLMGNRGDDRLFGGIGDDRLFGGAGRDTIAGGPGRDRLKGGKGDDLFLFAPGDGRDVIADFRNGDRIDLTAFDTTRGAVRLKAVDDGTLVRVGDVRILIVDVDRHAIDRGEDLII
jgi:uncharacterized protein (TIGR01370 family)